MKQSQTQNAGTNPLECADTLRHIFEFTPIFPCLLVFRRVNSLFKDVIEALLRDPKETTLDLISHAITLDDLDEDERVACRDRYDNTDRDAYPLKTLSFERINHLRYGDTKSCVRLLARLMPQVTTIKAFCDYNTHNIESLISEFRKRNALKKLVLLGGIDDIKNVCTKLSPTPTENENEKEPAQQPRKRLKFIRYGHEDSDSDSDTDPDPYSYSYSGSEKRRVEEFMTIGQRPRRKAHLVEKEVEKGSDNRIELIVVSSHTIRSTRWEREYLAQDQNPYGSAFKLLEEIKHQDPYCLLNELTHGKHVQVHVSMLYSRFHIWVPELIGRVPGVKVESKHMCKSGQENFADLQVVKDVLVYYILENKGVLATRLAELKALCDSPRVLAMLLVGTLVADPAKLPCILNDCKSQIDLFKQDARSLMYIVRMALGLLRERRDQFGVGDLLRYVLPLFPLVHLSVLSPQNRSPLYYLLRMPGLSCKYDELVNKFLRKMPKQQLMTAVAGADIFKWLTEEDTELDPAGTPMVKFNTVMMPMEETLSRKGLWISGDVRLRTIYHYVDMSSDLGEALFNHLGMELVPVDLQDKDGKTALHSNPSNAEQLFSLAANQARFRQIQDNDGKTAFMYFLESRPKNLNDNENLKLLMPQSREEWFTRDRQKYCNPTSSLEYAARYLSEYWFNFCVAKIKEGNLFTPEMEQAIEEAMSEFATWAPKRTYSRFLYEQ